MNYQDQLNSKPAVRTPEKYYDVLKGLPTEPMSNVREAELVARLLHNRSDEDAINELALSAMREAFAYGAVCSRHKMHPGELLSCCYTALYSAAKNYRTGESHRFFNYAKIYVRSEVCRSYDSLFVVKRGTTVPLPEPSQSDGREASEDHRIGETLVTQTEDVRHFQSIYVVESDMEGILHRDEFESLAPIIKKLNEKERTILKLRYWSGFNFREIGELFGTTRSDAEASCRRALKKIRCELYRTKTLFNR